MKISALTFAKDAVRLNDPLRAGSCLTGDGSVSIGTSAAPRDSLRLTQALHPCATFGWPSTFGPIDREGTTVTIEKVYAQLSCSDLAQSVAWFERLFGRAPDSRPMDGLAEWHHHDHAGFQLFQNASNAGRGTLTLIVSGLRDEHSRLTRNGIESPEIEPADSTSLIQLRDPDENLVVLAQPGRP